MPPDRKQLLLEAIQAGVDERLSAGREARRQALLAKDANREQGPSPVMTNPSLTIRQKVCLTEEQNLLVRRAVEGGESMFITGKAGTGKTVLLREIISSLKRKFKAEPDTVAVTASTGVAACSLGGTTLHRFLGLGLVREGDSVKALVRRISKRDKAGKRVVDRWAKTRVLVIDEGKRYTLQAVDLPVVSMIPAHVFQHLSDVAQAVRHSNLPFGGIQVISCGDFFQLPPVSPPGLPPSFAFQSQVWQQAFPTDVCLTQVFRQKEPELVRLLNDVREGVLTEGSEGLLKTLSRPLPETSSQPVTRLYPCRVEVDAANAAKLSALDGHTASYISHDRDHSPQSGQVQRQTLEALDKSVLCPAQLDLKVGASVMLVKNMDGTLVNGLVGKVTGFSSDGEEAEGLHAGVQIHLAAGNKGWPVLPLVQFRDSKGSQVVLIEPVRFDVEDERGRLLLSRFQLPLMLAWAMSIHKSQGQTLKRVSVDLAKLFTHGQAYVALSRASSVGGLQVLNFGKRGPGIAPAVLARQKQLANQVR